MLEFVLAAQAIHVATTPHQANDGAVGQRGGRGKVVLADIIYEGLVDKPFRPALITAGQVYVSVIQRDRSKATDRSGQRTQSTPLVCPGRKGVCISQVHDALSWAIPAAAPEHEQFIRYADRGRQTKRRARIIRQSPAIARLDVPGKGLPVKWPGRWSRRR